MPDERAPPPAAETGAARCRATGRFIAKEGAFALHGADADVWLELDPIPLHLLDEDVEITGRRYGASLIWVEAIGPVRSLS
ncbi:DUF5818 domain-containing protein [Sphingomonas profundi]|uniref:DUF5818 domain-containing protein n=1 Tax=Alterirhizorhabdus profundi TaxID=2681549 RepID=UPI0012E92F56|nr:DUF5818 domain-containing protein [Sphingomonas profundi]